MKLARKLTLAMALLASAVLALHALFEIRSEWESIVSDMRDDHLLMGQALAGVVRKTWLLEGEAEAIAQLEQVNRYQRDVTFRWKWSDPAPGGDQPVSVEVGSGDAAKLVTYLPVEAGGRRGVIEVSQSLASRREVLARKISSMAIATVALFGVFMVAATWLGRRLVGRPVAALVQQASRVSAGDLTGTVGAHGNDELGELASALDEMTASLATARARLDEETAARIHAIQALRHADRLTTVGKLAAGVAHELGTPLNVVFSRGKMISSGEQTGEPARQSGRIIAEQAQAMTAIIRQLLDFARRRVPERRAEDIGGLVAKAVGLIEPLAAKKAIEIQRVVEPAVTAEVDGGQVQQVLTNLLVNAVQASPPGAGPIAVEVARLRAAPPPQVGGPERDVVRVVVRDHGPGIPEAVRAHLFEPFFTTKDVGEGTGLGLAVSYGIVTEHGGWISVETSSEGTAFSVFLPRGES